MMFKDRRHDLLKIGSRIHRHQKNLSRYCKDVQTTHKANIIRRNLQGKNHSQNIRQKKRHKILDLRHRMRIVSLRSNNLKS